MFGVCRIGYDLKQKLKMDYREVLRTLKCCNNIKLAEFRQDPNNKDFFSCYATMEHYWKRNITTGMSTMDGIIIVFC